MTFEYPEVSPADWVSKDRGWHKLSVQYSAAQRRESISSCVYSGQPLSVEELNIGVFGFSLEQYRPI